MNDFITSPWSWEKLGKCALIAFGIVAFVSTAIATMPTDADQTIKYENLKIQIGSAEIQLDQMRKSFSVDGISAVEEVEIITAITILEQLKIKAISAGKHCDCVFDFDD